MQSRIFFIITPAFSVTWSFRNHYNLFDSQETFLIIINVEKNFAASYFCVEMVIHFIFQDFLINIKFNELHLFAFIKYINYIC